MAVLTSRVVPGSAAFRANRDEMLAMLETVRAAERQVERHSDARRPVFDKRGQLHPRDRVARLLDRGSPFLEFSTLAGWGLHGDDGGDHDLLGEQPGHSPPSDHGGAERVALRPIIGKRKHGRGRVSKL